ncbi:NAD(P)-dependent oxidoreductase [Agrobacterium deltaense]|uniref:NAD(P)H-binding protein n=1 Tax=Agrobacterium TaxID=357 RepID=UPI0007459E32|nr:MULTISPECIES: NAD(P)H-binding protein [Agrobacterium]KVK53998.1 hypothetical protein L901_19120 [Agrobacterium sp. D14]RKF40660.1 NAD(P)-dependent oxidoreductase [Agrobacterium deltaense]
MNIGVSGASGHLGQAIIRELHARGRGHNIVAISRTPNTAIAGLDRLILIPSAQLEPGVRGRQISAAVDAAVKAGVAHVYLVSAAGTREETTPAIGEAYWTAEQHLIRHAPRWTIMRMNYYIEAMIDELKSAIDQGLVAGLGSERVAYVSRDDLAAALAGVLVSDGHSGAIYNVTGPETLSGEDRAAALSEVTGKSIPFVVITEEVLQGGLNQAGLPDVVIGALTDIKRDFVAGKYDILTTDLERLSGRKPQRLRDLLAKSLA